MKTATAALCHLRDIDRASNSAAMMRENREHMSPSQVYDTRREMEVGFQFFHGKENMDFKHV
jgi:hypothetical protein